MLLSVLVSKVGGAYAGNVLPLVDFAKPKEKVGVAILFSSLFGAGAFSVAVGLAVNGEVNVAAVPGNENPPSRGTDSFVVVADVVLGTG